MKCANEMLSILNCKREADRLAKIAKEEENERLRSGMGSAAVNFCENEISKALEKCASNGQNVCNIQLGRSYWFDDIQNAVYRLKVSSGCYANGKDSCEPTGVPMDLKTIVEYLEFHCYNVHVCESVYMRYGWGGQVAYTLCITIPENPCE